MSTCGTSLLTNDAARELGQFLRERSNARRDDLAREDVARIEAHVEDRRARLAGSSDEDARKCSAEINGILALYGGDLRAGVGDLHHVIATDTMQGLATAEVVAGWLRARGLHVEVRRQRDLQTARLDGFMAAMAELAAWCAETLPGYRKRRYRVVFNLVGGFKSVNGFMQALGMLYADESVYLFETESRLLRLPRLPLQLDFAATVERHLGTFRRLALDDALTPAETAEMPETLLLEIDGSVILSPWGQLAFVESRRTLYERQVWPSPLDAVRFGAAFLRSCEGLPASRIAVINERIDDLGRFVLHGSAPKRLDLKPLRADPVPGSTHEVDAWADGDARRIFLHREGNRWVLDRLGPALH